MKSDKNVEFAFEEQYCLATIALMLSEVLREKGLSQSEVARRLGVTHPVVHRLLSANGNPTIKTLVRFLQVLDLKLDVTFKKRDIDVESRTT